MRGPVLTLLLLLYTSSFAADVRPNEFSPKHYQSADGALLLQTDGDYVEPYFATKALLVAQDTGLDVRSAGLAWIQWGLSHQRKDGRFERWCRKQKENWHACAAADADDSMLALWLQLLYRMAPDSGIPIAWKSSVEKAHKQLAKLRNVRLGIYHVSGNNHAMLFMDNVEVYSALKDIGHAQHRFGDEAAANATDTEAKKLASAIQHVFWDGHNHRFRPSIEKTRPAFYPDVVAQVFPWLADLPVPGEDEHAAWTDWKQKFELAWLETRYDTHPWGLVAVAALKVGDNGTAICWLSRSEPLRYSTRWNLLEEAAFQGLENKLGAGRAAGPVACSEPASHPEGMGQP
jgi:hypothetical protein